MKKTILSLTAAFLLFTPLMAQDSSLSNETKAVKQADLSEYPDFVAFMDEYNLTTYSSHKKLTLMHKSNNLAKLGKESVNGDVSGTLSYKTSLSGFNGVVTMEYKNYSDNPEWILDGFTNTKANIWANGKMFGSVKITGKYTAMISYENLEIVDGKAGGGFYTIYYPDGRKGKVMWDAIKKLPPIKK